MLGVLAVLCGLTAYAVFLVTPVYGIGFVGNIFVPKSIDSGARRSLGQALIIDTLVLGLFAVQQGHGAANGIATFI
jgi:hypothetical protein